jgi:putative transposase
MGRRPFGQTRLGSIPRRAASSGWSTHVYPVEWKNLIERMNQALKDRLECFDDLFPCLKEGCNHRHVSNWVSVFRYFHNVIRTDDDRPEYQRFIQSLLEALS